MWLEKIFNLKYLAMLVSALLLIVGVCCIFLGMTKIYHGLIILVGLESGMPGLQFVESIDVLLFSIVILILAGGIFKIFVGDENTFKNSLVFSKLKGFRDLKVLLWETLLLTLTVYCTLDLFEYSDEVTWENLILPISILLLAAALRILVYGKKSAH